MVGAGGGDDADDGCGEDEPVGASEADDAMASHPRLDDRESCQPPVVGADGDRSPGRYDRRCAGTGDEVADVVRTIANY